MYMYQAWKVNSNVYMCQGYPFGLFENDVMI